MFGRYAEIYERKLPRLHMPFRRMNNIGCETIIRASRSVTANIAEGYGRFHYTENIQFARLARGSLYEIIDHLTVAQEEKLISDETFTLLRENAVRAKSVDHV